MNLDLNNKRAVVCGSTQGIGKAAALELAALGASITLIARNEEKLKKVIDELQSVGGKNHNYLVADFAKPEMLRKVLQAYSNSNEVQILINNTGGPAGGNIADAKIESFVEAFNNHLICNHILATHFIPAMKKLNYGRIINIISTSVKIPLNGLGVSNTIRGAVANWSKTLANELGVFNITVNNVLPGATNTVRLQSIAESKASSSNKNANDVLDSMAAAVPMKRIAEPEEVANAIAFLASPAASYINGINLPVDGGRTGSL